MTFKFLILLSYFQKYKSGIENLSDVVLKRWVRMSYALRLKYSVSQKFGQTQKKVFTFDQRTHSTDFVVSKF